MNNHRNYNKVFPRRKSLVHLKEYIETKQSYGWVLKGEIKQNYDGEYCCMMVFEGRK